MPDKKIRDLSFNISFKAFEDKPIHAKVYWISNKKDVVLIGEYEKEKKQKYIESISSKVSLIFGDEFENYTRNYEYIEFSKGWHKFKDAVGVEDKMEILIKSKPLKLNIIEKRSIGTSYIEYVFKKLKSKKVLYKVEHKSFIGLQSIKVENTIEYREVDNVVFPESVEVVTKQKLINGNEDSPVRELLEEYIFSNYQLNKREALKHFSSN